MAMILSPINSYGVPTPNRFMEEQGTNWEYLDGIDPETQDHFKDACLNSERTAGARIQMCYSTQENGVTRIFFYSQHDSLTFPTASGRGFSVPLSVDNQVSVRMNFFTTPNHYGIYPDVNNGNSRQLVSFLNAGYNTLTVTLPSTQRGNMTFVFNGLNLLNRNRLFPVTQTH